MSTLTIEKQPARHIPTSSRRRQGASWAAGRPCWPPSPIAIFIANSFASPLLPRPLEPVGCDLQLHRKGDDRVCDGAADHLQARSTSRSLRSSRWPRPPWARPHRPASGTPALVVIGIGVGLALRRVQRRSRHPARPSLHRGHDRHDEPVPRHRLHRPRRPGLWRLSGELRLLRAGLCRRWVDSPFEFVARSLVLAPWPSASCCTATSFGRARLRDRQQS